VRTSGLDPGFREYLLGIADVSERDLDKLAEELRHHWSETVEEYVRRRHRELQKQRIPTRDIYGLIQGELSDRRFGGRHRSERQIRRLIYG
jgi:hypothetical protein